MTGFDFGLLNTEKFQRTVAAWIWGGEMQRNKVKPKPSMRWQFRSLQDLIQHFENRLSNLEIEKIIRDIGQLYICRGAETDEQERLTFIERCRQALQGSLLLHREQLFEDIPKAKA